MKKKVKIIIILPKKKKNKKKTQKKQPHKHHDNLNEHNIGPKDYTMILNTIFKAKRHLHTIPVIISYTTQR